MKRIHAENPNLFIIGDFNTSFKKGEENLCISSKTTADLKELFLDLKLINVTSEIQNNIDHIVIPEAFTNQFFDTGIVVEKDLISDHQGIFISTDHKKNQ